MAITSDEYWDTKSNQEAEGSIGTARRKDISPAFYDEPTQHARVVLPEDEQEAPEEAEGGFPLTESQLKSLTRSAYTQGASYQQTTLHPRWQAAYNSFNNKHNSDSKYQSSRFRGRSRLFRPKTRATTRKKMAEAAAALFATSEAIQIEAADKTDKNQEAGAALTAALLHFRLNRANENNGVPWFRIASGAHFSALTTSVCISMQSWEYREKITGYEDVPRTLPIPGLEHIVFGYDKVPIKQIVRDRPRITLFPPEDVIRDPGAAWEDQAQDSSYLILKHPMTVESARTFVQNANPKSAFKFREVPDSELMAAAGVKSDPAGSANVRRAREQSGNDRLSDHTVDAMYQPLWLHLNFLRVEGEDYAYWTIGIDNLISNVIPVEEAYPEFGGARPITIGIGALEPFKTDPMSPVESWQPLQMEINDLVNLRLDTLKQTISPLAKVRKGRSVDVRAIQNRTPDSVVYVQDLDDVEFDRPTGPSGESYLEMERLNADFDDQAGNFSLGSVQTNRQLGETVGGMQMMTSNANALGEFDLRTWVETWVEPTLRQVVKLIQFYESDENVIALSAKKAGVWEQTQRMGMDQAVDKLLQSQVTLICDVGLGASDPMMSMGKFAQAAQIAGGLIGPELMQAVKRDKIIDEVFGKAGYKDAAERFFNKEQVEEDPRLMQAQQMIQQMQEALMQAQQELQNKDKDNATRIEVAKINATAGLAKQEMSQEMALQTQFADAAMGMVQGEQDRDFQREQGAVSHAQSMEMHNAEAQQAQQVEQDQMAAKPAPQGQAGAPQGQDLAALTETITQGFQMLAQLIARSQQPQQPQPTPQQPQPGF
jgi:hypothetical protein